MTRRLLLPLLLAAVVVVAVLGAYGAVIRQRAQPDSSKPAADAGALDPDTHDHAALASEPQAGLGQGTERGAVELDTRRQQLIGVRTVTVRRAGLDRTLRTAGTVTADETRQSEISTRLDGWIRELMADFTGRVIRRGEPLFTLYSPDLIATQQEYLLALRGRTASAQDERGREYSERLITAARERLLRLDMAPEEIDRLERTGQVTETITFRSPVAGTIVEKGAVRGMRIMAGQMLYRVSDLSSVWVEAEVPEADLATVRPGLAATVTFQAYPGRTFNARVSFVSPSITAETRSARVRLALPNAGGRLKPNMLAEVTLQSPGGSALVVPADAIVNTGTETFAFVAEGEGRFVPRRVRIGRTTADGVEVVSGLTDGETVAASATFFLDSESQLRGALQNYEAPPPSAPAASGKAASGQAAPSAPLAIAFTPDPASPRPGDVMVMVDVAEGGKPLTGAEVGVVLSMPAMPSMNMPAMRSDATLVDAGGGTYHGTAQVMTPGRWNVAVTVRRGGQTLGTRLFSLIAR